MAIRPTSQLKKILRPIIGTHRCQRHRFYYGITMKQSIEAKYIIDLRSDTVTKPSIGMRNAIEGAIVGDDVLEEDKTVIELENSMADITKKEAGLFVTSGTMGNLLSILAHCPRRGSEVLLGNKSHIFQSEQGNLSQFGGVHPFPVPTQPDGTFSIEHLDSCVREDDFHYPATELICIENTHGNLGGKVLPLCWIDEVASFATEKGLPIHMDAARVFNASVASGNPVSRILRDVQSASICLSKSLGAPVGSVIVGDHAFIKRTRRLRKAIGGGWRQAGILAAAGLYALNHNIQLLSKDHTNAKLIANGINAVNRSNFCVDVEGVHSNIILFEVDKDVISPLEFCRRMMEVSREEEETFGRTVSVLASPKDSSSIRLVTHLDLTEEDANTAVKKIQFLIKTV